MDNFRVIPPSVDLSSEYSTSSGLAIPISQMSEMANLSAIASQILFQSSNNYNKQQNGNGPNTPSPAVSSPKREPADQLKEEHLAQWPPSSPSGQRPALSEPEILPLPHNFPSFQPQLQSQQTQTALLSQLGQDLMLYNLLLRKEMTTNVLDLLASSSPSPHSNQPLLASTYSPPLLPVLPVLANPQPTTGRNGNNANECRPNGKGSPQSKSPNFSKNEVKTAEMGNFSSKRHPTECLICAKMSLYNYYGVKCCESCKQFFRRTIVRQSEFFCARTGKCEIEGGEKCRGCRMDRCLLVGMDPKLISGIKNCLDEERKKQFLVKLELRRAMLLERGRGGEAGN